MSSTPSQTSGPQRRLTLLDSTSIIVGIIIGAGIYQSTPFIASNVHSPAELIFAWILGGLIALIGALCYAELCTAYPREGGDYVFLTKAYGRKFGFFFVWSEFWIVKPGSIGAMAFVLAPYAKDLIPLELGAYSQMIYAGGAILVLTAINILGVQGAKWTQNALTAVKVIGLLVVFVIGMVLVSPAESSETIRASEHSPSFTIAMVLILFTYGGWNDMSYVAAEVRDPSKNIFRALVIGTATVAVIYILINLAFLRGLGLEGTANSSAVAADLVRLKFGPWASAAISLLVCISCLGAINGMIFTSSRIYYAMGRQHRLYAWLGNWSEKLDSPSRALFLQGLVTLALVMVVGFYDDGFERMVIISSPFFWFFFLLASVSLFVLRRKEPEVTRPYRVILYPITPILFAISCLFMLYSSLDYMLSRVSGDKEGFYLAGLWALAVIVLGLIACFLDPPVENSDSSSM